MTKGEEELPSPFPSQGPASGPLFRAGPQPSWAPCLLRPARCGRLQEDSSGWPGPWVTSEPRVTSGCLSFSHQGRGRRAPAPRPSEGRAGDKSSAGLAGGRGDLQPQAAAATLPHGPLLALPSWSVLPPPPHGSLPAWGRAGPALPLRGSRMLGWGVGAAALGGGA